MKKIILYSLFLALVLSGCSNVQAANQIHQSSAVRTAVIPATAIAATTPPEPGAASTTAPVETTTAVIEATSTAEPALLGDGLLTEISASADGKWIAIASSTGFDLLDQKNNQVIASIPSETPINGIDFSPDSSQLVIGLENGRIALYRVTDLVDKNPDEILPVLEFKAHSLPVTSVQFGKTNEVIISTSSDRTAVTWNTETGKRIHTFAGFDADITTLVYSPDYRFIAVGSYDGTIRIWNATSGHLWKEFGESDGTRALRAEYPSALMFDETTGRLVIGWGDGTIRIWQWQFGNEEAYTISLGENSIIALVQYNNSMVSVDFYGNAIFFNMTTNVNRVGVEKIQEFSLGQNIQSIVFLPEDQTLLLGRTPAQIDAFHLNGGEITTLYKSALQSNIRE